MLKARKLRVVGVYLAVFSSLFIIHSFNSQIAESATITEIKPGVPVSLKIPDTDLLVTGCAPPNSLVTITDANTVVGSTTSDNTGKFSRLLMSQTPTIHSIGTQFEDRDGKKSTPTSNLVALVSKTLTYLDVYSSPTVSHKPEIIEVGQNITFQGYTCPNATVTLNIDNNITLDTTSNSSGFWTITVNSLNFTEGTHTYNVFASGSGFKTINSNKAQFKVLQSTPSETEDDFVADLSIPVVITSPEDGYRTETRDVLVIGTGPPNAQIEVFVDGELVGSIFSNAYGEWSLKLSVLGAQQTLQARACNSFGCGDISNSIKVYYGSASNLDPLKACDIKLYLKKYRFSSLEVGKGIDIDLKIEGGSENDRYNLTIDWGDVTVNHQTLDSDNLRIHHTYDTKGQFNGTVSAERLDSDCKDIVYFSVQVTDKQDEQNTIAYIIIFIITILIYIIFKQSIRNELKQNI